MQAALRLTTRVLPGKRVEFTAPELTEGEDVEIFIALPPSAPRPDGKVFASAAEYLDSLSPVPRSPDEWAALEREMTEEKSAWDL